MESVAPRITFQRANEWFVQRLDGSGLRRRQSGDKRTRSISPLGTYAVADMRMGSPWNIDSVFRLTDGEEVFDLGDWSDDVSSYGWLDETRLIVPIRDETLIVDVESKAIRKLPIGGGYLCVAGGCIALQSDEHTWVINVNDGSRIDVGPGMPRALSPSGNQVCVRRGKQHYLLRRPFERAEPIDPPEGSLLVAGYTHSSLLFGTLRTERSYIVVRDAVRGVWLRVTRSGEDARPRLHPEHDLLLYDHGDHEAWVIDEGEPRRVATDARYARWVHRFEEPR